MTPLRDFQRSRVYDAEHLVHRIFDRSADFPVIDIAGSHLTLPIERKFGSIQAVQGYVDQVLELNWVDERWRRAGSVMAVPGVRSGSAWALRELVILHELAHHLADDIEIAHGGAFVQRLITLIDGVIGPEAAFLLRVTMLDVGVRIG